MEHEDEDMISSRFTRDYPSKTRMMAHDYLWIERDLQELGRECDNLQRRRKCLAAIIRISNSLWDMEKVC